MEENFIFLTDKKLVHINPLVPMTDVNAFKALDFFVAVTFVFLLKAASVGWFWSLHNGSKFQILD